MRAVRRGSRATPRERVQSILEGYKKDVLDSTDYELALEGVKAKNFGKEEYVEVVEGKGFFAFALTF